MENGICRRCGGKLVIKETKKSASQLKKPYYYTAYYVCTYCNTLYHDDKFKVENSQTSEMGLFENEPTVVSPKRKKYDVEIWTDGACVHNGTPKARAAWAFVSGETEKAGRVVGKQTNNIAEALAIYYGLQWAAENGYTKIALHTDSQISLFNLKKPARLVKANREIFEDIEKVIQKNKLEVTYVKVLGHSGDINNERADKLANTLATKE